MNHNTLFLLASQYHAILIIARFDIANTANDVVVFVEWTLQSFWSWCMKNVRENFNCNLGPSVWQLTSSLTRTIMWMRMQPIIPICRYRYIWTNFHLFAVVFHKLYGNSCSKTCETNLLFKRQETCRNSVSRSSGSLLIAKIKLTTKPQCRRSRRNCIWNLLVKLMLAPVGGIIRTKYMYL